jgi:hypothetical protein
MKQNVMEILLTLKNEIGEFECRVLDDKPRAALLRTYDIAIILLDLREEMEKWIENSTKK